MTTLPIDLAVYAEYSPARKLVQPGWNARVFNKREVEEGSSIRFDDATGVITLSAGVYHISGVSFVTYSDPSAGAGRVSTESNPNAGYCRLRYAKDVNCKNELAIAIGTVSNANMGPSTVETFLDVPKLAQVVLEHQVGDDVAGIYLQDNSGNSTWHIFARIAIRRVLRTSTQYERSSIARVFDAALGTYLAIPQAYQRLYASYLGVQPKFVPTSDEGSWPAATDPRLSKMLNRGTLRFGYVENAPYVYHGGPPDSGLRGTDWTLGKALTEIIRNQYAAYIGMQGLRAEWIPVTVPAGGDPEVAKFDALHAGLTKLLHTNILYTGRDGYDLSGIVGASRDRFIDAVKSWPEVIVMCMTNPGPSPTNSAALVDSINAAGGHATLQKMNTLQAMTDAIANQTVHFSVGDPVASSWIGNQVGFKGLNLDIAASTKPLQTAQIVAAFTLPA